MDSPGASERLDASPQSPESDYLTTSDLAKRLKVSQSTVARYHTEFAAYLSPFAPPGGGRGLKPEALQVLKVIREMKARRASWIEIKQALEAQFGSGATPEETLEGRSFRRSLEAIHQAQQALSNELHLLLREVNRRLDQLEKSARQVRQSRRMAREQESKGQEESEAPQPGYLFPDRNDSKESAT